MDKGVGFEPVLVQTQPLPLYSPPLPIDTHYSPLTTHFNPDTSTLEGVSLPLTMPRELRAMALIIMAMFSISSVPISSLALW